MPGVKFSELATTTVIAGTELVPILQQGVNRVTTLDSVTSPLQQSITDNTLSINTLTGTVDGISAQFSGLQGTVNAISSDLSITTGNIASNATEIDSLRTSLSALHVSDIIDTNLRINTLSAAIDTNIADISTTNTAVTDNTTRISTLSGDISTTNTAVTDNTTRISTLSSQHTTDISSIDSQTTSLSTSLTVTNTRIDALSSTVATVADNASLINTLSALHLGDDVDDAVLATQLSTLSAEHDTSIAELRALININASADTGAPVFITYVNNNIGIIETTYRSGTVPADLIISGVTVDDDSDLTVKIEWDGPASSWMGTASINGTAISTSDISRIGTTRRFEAIIDVNATGLSSLSAVANGSVHEVPITLLGGGPEITSVSFGPIPTTGGYQPAMFLDGDTVAVTVEFNTSDVDTISLYQGNSYATNSVTNMSVTPAGDPPTATFNATVDTTNTSITNLPIKISAKNSFGTEGPEYTSTSQIPCRHGPEITNMSFGNYPGSQTELKNNDTIQVTVEFDTNDVTKIDFGGGNSYADNGQELTVNPVSLSATKTMTIGTNRTTVQQQSARARPKGSSSNYGQYHTSASTLAINNAYPTYSGYSVTYPASQTAVKGTETVDVTLNVSNQGSNPTYTYSSTTGELNVPNTSQYAATKQLTCTSPGTYNISSNNYRLVVNRAENDATSTSNQLVWVVDTLPTISVSYPGSRMRSGGNDGTDVQQYQIEVTSNQRLESFAMSTDTSAGTLDGSWQSYSNGTVWRRQLKVSDDTGKGTFSWSNMIATNLANSAQSTINSGSSYILGGFVERTLTVPSQGWQVTADVEATDYSKVDINWSKKNLTVQASLGDTTRPQTATWSLDRLSPQPITVNILDSGATNASSVATTLTIEETV
jgi:hypothetical protein